MSEAFEFEVRPIEGATAVIGEEVTFRSEDGKLYVLNEDGEAFGVVPKAVAARLEAAGVDSLAAEVASRAGGMPTISVAGFSGEGAAVGAAGVATVAAATAATSTSTEEAAVMGWQAEPAKLEQTAAAPQAVHAASSRGSHFAKSAQPVEDAQPVENAQPVEDVQPAEDIPSAEDPSHGSTVEQDQGGKKPKGKYIVIGVVAVVVVLFVICAIMLFADSGSDDMQTVSDGTISLEVPADWEVEEDDGTYVINSTNHDAAVTFVSDDILDGSLTADEVCEAVASGVNSDDSSYLDESSAEDTTTADGAFIRVYDYEYLYDDEEYEGKVEIILSGASLSVVGAVGTDEYEDEIEDVLDSVTVLDPSEPDLLDADAAEEEEEEEAVEDDDEEDVSESASSSTSELLDPEILESGYHLTDDGYVYYAVCWQNPNEGYAIEFPELTITGRDADGAITFADSQTMSELLPGEVQYFSGFAGGGEGTVTVEFGVSQVDDGDFEATDEVAEEYYTISNTSAIDNDYYVSFTGEITTNVELEDFDEAWLSVVLRDEEGNIVYGEFGFVDLAAEGGTVAFEIEAYDLPDYATYEIYAIPW